MTIHHRWRWAVCAAIALLTLAVAWSGPPHHPMARLAPGGLSDIGLYEAVARQVGRGGDYYAWAVRLQRENGFPLRPFVTVRLPTLAWIVGHIGYRAALALALTAVLANVLVWFAAIDFARPAERVSIAALIVAASIMVPRAVYLHEWWAGQLLTAALGLYLAKRPRAGLALAVAALFVREHSLLFILASLPFLPERERRGGWIGAGVAIAAFGIALALHRAEVTALVLPGDPTSPGWLGLRGPAGPSSDLQAMVLFDLVPEPLGSLLVFAPLLGWGEVAVRRSALPVAWFSGFLVVLAVLARADNGFWVRMILPAYMAGLALVPPALLALAGDAVRVRSGIRPRTAPGDGTTGSPAAKG